MSLRYSMRILAAAVVLSAAAFAQDGNFMVRYITNLNPPGGGATDTVVSITNTGASWNLFYPARNGGSFISPFGFVCANVYVFSPDEQLQECCATIMTPNALFSYSGIRDLISNTLTTAKPNSIVVKIVGTIGICNAASAGQIDPVTNNQISVLAPGLAAWARNAQGGETAFQVGTLTPAELTRATALCAFNQVNGSGTGTCKTGTLGGVPGSSGQ